MAVSFWFFSCTLGFFLFLSYRLKEKDMFKDTALYIILRNKLSNFSPKRGSLSLELLKI